MTILPPVLSEWCPCGARLDVGWLVPWWVARRAVTDWRTSHPHTDDALHLGGYGGSAQTDQSTDEGQPVLGFRAGGPT